MEGKSQNPVDHFKHLSIFWTDLIHLMMNKPHALASAGPMRNMADNTKTITKELLEAGGEMAEFGNALSTYYAQLSDVFMKAQEKVNSRIPEIPDDPERFEAYKRIWIDIFDNDFTDLFDSETFGENYGKLVAKELALVKHWNNVTGVMLKSANLPSRQEIDEVYREIHSMRRRIARLEAERAGDKKTPVSEEKSQRDSVNPEVKKPRKQTRKKKVAKTTTPGSAKSGIGGGKRAK